MSKIVAWVASLVWLRIALLGLLAGFIPLSAAPLDEAFQNPAEASKPWCW